MIGGAQLEAREIQLLEPGEYFGIWFLPGALRHFVDLNLSEISGQFVDGSYFEAPGFQALHDEIYSHRKFTARVGTCERWLLELYAYKPVANFDHALSVIYQSAGNEKVGVVAEKVGWSSRHLNRQFLQYTGLSTKVFSQIIRAQGVCKQLYCKPGFSLSVSLNSDYYDQSHLIKAFKKFLKSTPGEFVRQSMSDFYNR